MYCSNCGQEVQRKDAHCPHCGAAVNGGGQKQAAMGRDTSGIPYIHKKKWVAFFLCLFLGEIGIHRFYVGKVGTGILYFFTLGLCGIGYLVDLITILLGSFKDRAGQPLV